MDDATKAAVGRVRSVLAQESFDEGDFEGTDLAAILAHIDGEPARLAAAREEQREACATAAAEWAREAALARGEPGNLFDAVMTTPLTSRPLADRIAELEKELSKAEWRVAELEDDVADARILLEPHFGQETYQLPLAKTTADLIAEWQRREAGEEKAEAERDEAVAALRALLPEVYGTHSPQTVGYAIERHRIIAQARAVLAKYPEGR